MPLVKNNRRNASIEGNTLFKRIYEICLFILIVGYFLFYETRMFQIAFVGVGLAGSLIITASKIYISRFKLPLNTIWYFIFFVLTEISAIWAYSPDNATSNYFRLMVILLFISLGITQYVDSTTDAEVLLKIFTCSALLVALIQLFSTPISEWGAGYFGSKIGGHNSNTFGFVCSMSSVISFYLGYIKNKHYHYIFVLVFVVCCLLTSSRKAFAISFVGFLLIILLARKKKHHLIHFAVAMGISFFALVLIIVDQTLYSIVGYRFESTFDFMSSGTTDETSLFLREYFINFAKILFFEKPIIGHGFANFSIILAAEGDVSKEVYAHNNYWEILADLGIVGFITYYWFYAFILIKLIIRFFKEKSNSLSILALAMIISQLILEFGLVSMTSFYPQILLSLIYVCSYASSSKRQYHYSPLQI